MDKPLALTSTRLPRRLRVPAQYAAASAALALLTYWGFIFQINLLTISLLYLMIVVAAASIFGFWQASYTSLAAVLLLDYFFEPPLFSFEVENTGIFVALLTFEATALAISRLHGRELRIAREAARQRAGMEQLYELSRSSLLLDLRQPPGPQLAVLIHRIFDVRGVALYDTNLSRQDRMGDWEAGEQDLAKDCFLRDASHDDSSTQTWQRVLRAGPGPVGALVVRGDLSALVVDALASLAAIAIDRYQWFEKEERAETAKKSEQLRGAVMDALAHEFKTPLTAVQTASSGLLELGGLTDPQRNLVTLIDGEAVRLNKLCTRLLKAAKLEAKQVGLDTADVNVLEVVSEVLATHPAEPERNSIEVAVEDPALTVRADRGLLAMILSQYVDNARKYSKAGTPIEIAARASHSEVLISVHNFGSTIRIEDRERIFERFYRSPELKDTVPGTGIGLSVVRKAAEAHHGHVWVISDDKDGTTFSLSLPMDARRTQ
ncbi:MAG: ATP-binding protein [Terracidiphilus sp.]|jgi:two-component system sensor histidine kinase KdpD